MTQEIDALTLSEWLKKDEAIVIDVREDEEFEAGHIKEAVSIPLSVFGQKYNRADFPADKKIVLQCQGGVRSMKACEIARTLAEKENVINLQGGLNAWKSQGLETVK